MEDKNFEPDQNGEENAASSGDEEVKTGISADLIRGHINTIILRTLYERDKYGYEIIEEIESKSHGQYTLKQPTLYSALKRLESQGYINAYWKNDEVSQGGRRKYYTLTDSGREITERNQAEWEYSRTVIDNLISDKNFDFSQPAPSAVDFKILKNSTTRVPTNRDDADNKDDSESAQREVSYDEPSKEHIVEIVHEERPTEIVTESKRDAEIENVEDVPSRKDDVEETHEEMSEEQKRLVHENYMKLISEPVNEQNNEAPYADTLDTDKLIYNNRPDTERDYRNLINNLFMKTIKAPVESSSPAPVSPRTFEPANEIIKTRTVKIDDEAMKANNDGLTVNPSEYVVSGSRRKRYNRGSTMFKCSLIIAVIMLLEFALCLIFKKELGVSLAYPFVIFALAGAQVLIFGVLCYTDIGKSSRKPTTLIYLSACIIICIICILIIFITSLLLNVTFSSAGDIMAKIVVPCFVALNIPAFAGFFYLFSK